MDTYFKQGTSNEYPQQMFLWRNKKTYPKIISKYSSLTILLPPDENMKLFCFHQTKVWNYFASTKQNIWIYFASTKQKFEIILLPQNKKMK